MVSNRTNQDSRLARFPRGGGVGYVGKLRQENTPHSLLSLHRTQLGRWDDVYDGVSALSLLLHVGFLSTSDRSLGGH